MPELRIKEVIKAKGLTVDAVAKRMGIIPSALSQSINGNPTVEKLYSIASAIGVDVRELFAPADTHTFACPKCGALLEIREKKADGE